MGTTEAPADPLPSREDDSAWIASFHNGDRNAIEECYRNHFATVDRAVRHILDGADRETIIHDVFSRLISREEVRRSFRGGSMGAWLTVVARNQAIDHRRRQVYEAALPAAMAESTPGAWQDGADTRLLIEQFRREQLPPDWQGVFDLCFLQQMSQREAARALGIRRSTLAYRELRIRRRLRRLLLEGDA